MIDAPRPRVCEDDWDATLADWLAGVFVAPLSVDTVISYRTGLGAQLLAALDHQPGCEDNDRGQILAGARITDAIRPGVVRVNEGGWFDPVNPREPGSLCRYGDVNNLTAGIGTSKLAQGNCGHTAVGDVEKYAETPPATDVFVAPASASDTHNHTRSTLMIQRTSTRRLLGNGLLIGIAGGLAEVAVTWSYMAMTGSDIATVGRGIADAVALNGASAATGLGIHMALAAGLGIVLLAARPAAVRPVPFMLASLAAIWTINFFVVLPFVSPAFVHLLPYAVTLASKLAFGLTAAGMMTLQVPSRSGRFGIVRLPFSTAATART